MLPASLQNVIGPTMTEVPVLATIKKDDTIITVAQRLQAQFIEDAAYEFAGMEEIIRGCTDWPSEVVDFGWRTGFQQEEKDNEAQEGNVKGSGLLHKGGSVAVHEYDLLPRDRPEIYATPKGGTLCLEFEGNRRFIGENVVKEVFERIERVLREVSPLQDLPKADLDSCLARIFNLTGTRYHSVSSLRPSGVPSNR